MSSSTLSQPADASGASTPTPRKTRSAWAGTKKSEQRRVRAARDTLRRDFPGCGILHDPWYGRWKAVWGRDGYAEADSATALRQLLTQARNSA